MYSLGSRDKNKEFVVSRDNKDIRDLISIFGKHRKEWFVDEFPDEYEEEFDTEYNLKYMSGTISDFMVHSDSLANASHYDCNDKSITICTWVENFIGNTDNWYFLLPNLVLTTTDKKRTR